MAMRNYRAMNPAKLERVLGELEARSGDAFERVVNKGDDLDAHLNAARSAAAAKGVEAEDVSPEGFAIPPGWEQTPPRVIPPMLAFDGNGNLGPIPRDGSWIMEPKWDGWRWQVHVTEQVRSTARTANGADLERHERSGSGTDVVVRSIGGRNGKDHSGEVPAVDAHLAATVPTGTILDGEIVWENTLIGSRATKQAMFVVFDLLAVAGSDITQRPWHERRKLLEQVIEPNEVVVLSQVSPVDDDVLAVWLDLGMEGAVAKRVDAPYAPGTRRRDNWIKVKPQSTTEAVVTGWVFGKGAGNQNRAGALEVTLIDTGVPTTVGYDSPPEEAEGLVGLTVELAHHGFQPSGKVRHPVFKRMRPDRDPA